MYETKLIGINEDIFELISVLRKMQVFHVIESSQRGRDDAHEDLQLRESKAKLENLETRASAIYATIDQELSSDSGEQKEIRSSINIIKDFERILSKIEPDIRRIEGEKEELKSKIEHLNRYKPVLKEIKPLIKEIEQKPDLESNLLMFNRKSDLDLMEFKK